MYDKCMEVLHISYNMCIHGLPDIYTLNHGQPFLSAMVMYHNSQQHVLTDTSYLIVVARAENVNPQKYFHEKVLLLFLRNL